MLHVYFLGKPSYHVQFFGNECHRGWIPDTRMTTYEGTEEHLKWLEKMKNEMGKSKRKDYEICKKQRRPAWDVACDEAAEVSVWVWVSLISKSAVGSLSMASSNITC